MTFSFYQFCLASHHHIRAKTFCGFLGEREKRVIDIGSIAIVLWVLTIFGENIFSLLFSLEIDNKLLLDILVPQPFLIRNLVRFILAY
jgi:hypothetical protein